MMAHLLDGDGARVEVVADHWFYPLQWGETLSSHDWFPMYGKRFLSSDFVAYACAEGRRADIGTAMILWAQSFDQDPAGTLPDDDVALARLAGFGADIEGWRAQRPTVLHGWRTVSIDGDRIGAPARLGHELIARICSDMYRRKAGREQSREARRVSTQRSRVRGKLREMKMTRLAESDHVVIAVTSWLGEHGLFIEEGNIRAGLEAVAGVPKVVGMDGEGR